MTLQRRPAHLRIETVQDAKTDTYSEDVLAVLCGEQNAHVLVADGAWQRIQTTRHLQPLLDRYGNETTPGRYAALVTRDTTLMHAVQHPSSPLREALLAANHQLRAQLATVWGALSTGAVLEREPDLTPLRDDPRLLRLILPVCVATLARIDLIGQTLDFAHCGDTALYVYYRDGRVEQLTDDQMQQHDERALERALQLQKEQGAANLIDTLFDERVTAVNREHGIYHNYEDAFGKPDTTVGVGTINGLPQLAAYIQEGRWSLDGVDAVLICSDGFSLPAPFRENRADTTTRLERMRARIEQNGLAGYIQELRTVERADETRDRYPRFGLHDDATAVYVRFDAT